MNSHADSAAARKIYEVTAMETFTLNSYDRPVGWPRGPVPAGSYEACIVSSYVDHFSEHLILALTWMVSEGKYRSRRVFDWLLLSGDEADVAAGYGKFLAIAKAVGHPAPESLTNPEELEGRPCLIRVGLLDMEGEPVNEVKSYAPRPAAEALPFPLAAVA